MLSQMCENSKNEAILLLPLHLSISVMLSWSHLLNYLRELRRSPKSVRSEMAALHEATHFPTKKDVLEFRDDTELIKQ